jgi:multisubunit Na+/H+ antiporter MnhB subunit
MKTKWSDLEQTELIAKVIQSYTRDTRLRDKWTDFDYTINSYDWFMPWFYDYFLNTSLLKISGTLSILACLFLLILLFYEIFKRNNKKKFNRNYLILVSAFFFISIYIWHKAPEIRFGSGLIISIPCFLLAIITGKLKIKKYFTHYKTFIAIMLLFICVCLKHFQKFDIKHLILINKGNTKYKHIEKIADINGIEIFQSLISKCGDFPKICVNKKKEDYKITNKYGYRIFLN